MTKEQVRQKISKILAKDPRFKGITIKIEYSEKKLKKEGTHRGELLNNDEEE